MKPSQKIRILIVDDEPPARSVVRNFLEAEEYIEIIAEASNGRQAVSMIKEHKPDLLFLDIQMPEMNGFEVIKRIGAENVPQIIFVTAYDQYALRAFDVHALDYLLKPFSRTRFRTALQRARNRIQTNQPGSLSDKLDKLLEELQIQPRYLERLAIQHEGRVIFVKTTEIDWIEAAEKYVCLHVGSSVHLLRQSMKVLEQNLDPAKFMRIHRSTIVSVERIKEIQPWFNGEFKIILANNIELLSSRKYRLRLRELCGNMALKMNG